MTTVTTVTPPSLSDLKDYPSFATLLFDANGFPLVWIADYMCSGCHVGQDLYFSSNVAPSTTKCPLCGEERKRIEVEWVGPADEESKTLWRGAFVRTMEIWRAKVEATRAKACDKAKEVYRHGRRLIRAENFEEAANVLLVGIEEAKAIDLGLTEEIGLLEDSWREAERKGAKAALEKVFERLKAVNGGGDQEELREALKAVYAPGVVAEQTYLNAAEAAGFKTEE